MLDRHVETWRFPRASALVADAEFRFTAVDFTAVAAILHREAGISLAPTKASLVYARLAKRLRALRLDSFAAYVALVQADRSERQHFVGALTTNVTRFFREPHHFDHIRNEMVCPPSRGRFRVWSAGCSTGQEPFSIAATVAELNRSGHAVDVRILATDIDPDVLQQAKAGAYASLDGVPAELRRWFRRDGPQWIAADALRALVTFRHLNLNAPWPFATPFDGILCRNVAIYFDKPTQERLWEKLAHILRPGGCLYLGHSERVSGTASASLTSVGTTTYRRRQDQS